MKRILITNDDGFKSPGIEALVRAFKGLGEVILVAPQDEKSCSSHSITSRHPLRVREVEVGGVRGYAVEGTPADTVILALRLFDDGLIDFVISGINRGPNLGFDVFYSGTVAAAMEAAMSGIPSLAVSLVVNNHFNYQLAAEVAVEVFETFEDLLRREKNAVLNLNIPDVPDKKDLQGWSITTLGDRFYLTRVKEIESQNPEVREFVLEEEKREASFPENSDFQAVWCSRVSITPLRPNLTDFILGEELREILQNKGLSSLYHPG